MSEVKVTREDREAAWSANLKFATTYTRGGWSEGFFDHGPTQIPFLSESLHQELVAMERVAKAIATARSEGRLEERRDVTAWLRSVEGWRPPKLAESIDDECHVGSEELRREGLLKVKP